MTEQVDRFCARCGAPRESSNIRFCRSCGAPFVDAGVPDLSGVRRRPLWMVGALAFLSSGLYQWIWTWVSWRELQRLSGDAGMRPFWHSLAIYVPIYGQFRLHAHYRVLDEVLRAAGGGPLRPTPLQLAILWAVVSAVSWGLTFYVFGRLPEIMAGTPVYETTVAYVISGAVLAYMVVVGQQALNARYLSAPGAAVPERTHAFEWVFLAIFGLIFVSQFLPA